MEGTRRPRRRRRRTVERLKNLLIVLLSLSAVYLALRTGLGRELPERWTGSIQALLRGQENPPPLHAAEGSQPDVVPVRISVVSGESGRFAVQYDQERTGEVYAALRGLLTEAMVSARTPRQITEGEWRRALQRQGAWFDFLGQIPLDTLCVWLGEGSHNPNLSGAVRRLLVARGAGDSILLYYCNEADGSYYACETTLTYAGRVEESLAPYDGNGASFAFETGSEGVYSVLDPDTLLSAAALSPRIYRSSNPLADGGALEQLQRSLSFRAQGDSGYLVQGGIRFREGRETLEILDRGVITYHSAEAAASRYSLEQTGPTACAKAAWYLAEAAVGDLCGASRLYLIDVSEHSGSTVVRLGYTLDGAAVRLSGEAEAARFVFQQGHITDYTLHLRSYEDTGERSLVLRELQAAAAQEILAPGRLEMALCYLDGGRDIVEAGWVAG